MKSPFIPTKYSRCSTSSFGSRCNVRLDMSDVPFGNSDEDMTVGINQSFDINAAIK